MMLTTITTDRQLRGAITNPGMSLPHLTRNDTHEVDSSNSPYNLHIPNFIYTTPLFLYLV